jgi:K+-transporting ATPase A subunit
MNILCKILVIKIFSRVLVIGRQKFSHISPSQASGKTNYADPSKSINTRASMNSACNIQSYSGSLITFKGETEVSSFTQDDIQLLLPTLSHAQY